MAARRVGFGEGREVRKRPPRAAPPEAEAPDAPPADDAGAPDAEEHKEIGPVARIVLVMFLLVWLTLWSVGLAEAYGHFVRGLAAVDIFTILFMGFWMLGAGLGWLFGAVLLIAVLFGKRVAPGTAKRKMQALRAARRGRAAASREHGGT